jgi:hypothetical protein
MDQGTQHPVPSGADCKGMQRNLFTTVSLGAAVLAVE